MMISNRNHVELTVILIFLMRLINILHGKQSEQKFRKNVHRRSEMYS